MSERVLHSAPPSMAGGSLGPLARAYYHIKPFIPASMRWAIRRFHSPSILRRNAATWPINYAASARPEDWQGWPHGKQFALVLTHDVESEAGLRNVGKLAELEMEMGFRSSFNFIPEGTYDDPVELREWLSGQDFEVGVHDLYHDGHLYKSRESFSQKARIINRYLGKWQAVGFRSGFMLRQLDWLHDLNLLYDTSTFDTDPFEPQPDGSQTIFPFFVKPPEGTSGQGYVELSYSLPQDSTLFLLLREKTPEIWKNKLEWIASHGGLALVNIHPDYIDFSGKGRSGSTYPAALLAGFLDHVKTTFGDSYWNPVAKELASWYKDRPAHPPHTSAHP